MLCGKKNPTDGSDKAWTTPLSPLFLWRPCPLSVTICISDQANQLRVECMLYMARNRKRLAFLFPWPLTFGGYCRPASCEPWSLVSALEAGDRDGDGDGVSVEVGVGVSLWPLHSYLNMHISSCFWVLSCLVFSGCLRAWLTDELFTLSLSLSLACISFSHSLPLIIRQLTVYIVAGYARSDCSVIRQGLR